MVAGFADTLGRFFGVIAALSLAEMPIVVTVMAIRGAVRWWGMEPIADIALFAGVPIVTIAINALGDKD